MFLTLEIYASLLAWNILKIDQEFGNAFDQPRSDPNKLAAHQDDETMLLNPFRHLHNWYLVNPKSSTATKRLALPKHWKFTGKTYKDAVLYGWLKPSSKNGVKPVLCRILELGDVTFDRTKYFRGIWILRKETYKPIYWLHEPDPVRVDGMPSQHDLNWSIRQLTAVMSNFLDFCFRYEDLPRSTAYGSYTVTQLHDHLQGTCFDLGLLAGCQTSVAKHLNGWCGLDTRSSPFLKSLLKFKSGKIAFSDLLAKLEEAEERSQIYPWGQPLPGFETSPSTCHYSRDPVPKQRRGLFDDSTTSDSDASNSTRPEYLSASLNHIQKKHDKQKLWNGKKYKKQRERRGSSILEENTGQHMPSSGKTSSMLTKEKGLIPVQKDEAKSEDNKDSPDISIPRKRRKAEQCSDARDLIKNIPPESNLPAWGGGGIMRPPAASVSSWGSTSTKLVTKTATKKKASHQSLPAASGSWGTASKLPELQKQANSSWGSASTKLLVTETAAKKKVSDQSLPAASGSWRTASNLPEGVRMKDERRR